MGRGGWRRQGVGEEGRQPNVKKRGEKKARASGRQARQSKGDAGRAWERKGNSQREERKKKQR